MGKLEILQTKYSNSSKVALTKNIDIKKGSHILYTYSNREKYIKNAISFIKTGLKLGQGILFVDEQDIINIICETLIKEEYSKEILDEIIFVNCKDFYENNEAVNPNRVINTFTNLVKPLTKREASLRTWGNVKWGSNQSCILDKLKKYEFEIDPVIGKINSISICAYDGESLTANMQLELMKNHQFIMTDNELTTSNLYDKKEKVSSLFIEEKNEEKIKYFVDKYEKMQSSYKNLIDKTPNAIFISSSTQVIYANQKATELIECDLNQIVGKDLSDIVHSDFREQLKHRINLLISGEQLPFVEKKFVTYKGNIVDVEVGTFLFEFKDLDTFTLISVVRDIRERKKLEELHLNQLHFNEKVFNSLQMGLIIIEDHQVKMINEKGLEILGVEKCDRFKIKTEKDIINLIINLDVDPVRKKKLVKAVIDNGVLRTNIECKCKDGTTLEFDFIPITINHMNNSYVWVIKDIGHRKKIEEDLKIAKKNAEKANEMKSMFLSQMSHDLRTPLNTIQGFTQIMLSELDGSSPKEKHKLHKIEGASKQLLKLIEELLDFSAIEAGILKITPEKINLRRFIYDCVNSITENWRNNGVSFFIRPIDSNLYVCTDPVRLKQILDNLLINAFKYNKSEGHVFVYVEEQDSKVIIKVADTGIGIPKNEINSIFDPFYRSKRNMSNWNGTGLGLAIVAKLTEKLRGEFGVNSEEGVGSTFWVSLPKINGNNRVTKKFENVSPPKQIKDKTILYIEDNLDNIQLIEAMLEIMGTIELISEHSGAAGLKKALEVHPDLIFLDLNLPGIDGLVLLSQLKNNQMTQDIPVVVISAEACELKIKEATKRGSYKYIKKPVNMSELHSVIKEVMS